MRSAVLLLAVACEGSAARDTATDARLGAFPLVWFRATEDDDFVRAEAGLRWSLALLGAAPSADLLVLREAGPDTVRFDLDLDAAGFPAAARPHVAAAVAPLLQSHEVAARGAMDVGRFLTRTLHAPGRYYAITGACATQSAWASERLGPEPATIVVTESLLVSGDRTLEYAPSPADTDGIAFAAHVPAGAPEDEEREVLDVMDNGFVRYAIYGPDGALRAAAEHSPAGQPAGCAWCHEMNLLRPSTADPVWAELDALLDPLEDVLLARQREAAGAVDLDTYEVHAWGEQLSLFFLEPPVARVAREWGVSVADVEALGLPTHDTPEYPDADPLLWRADVDAAAPIAGDALPVPVDGRAADAALTLEGSEALVGCRE